MEDVLCRPEVVCATAGGKVEGLELPKRVFPCASPAEVRSTLPEGKDVLAFQCRNPIHKAHYELFIRALDAPNVGEGAVCLVHPTCGPTQVLPPCAQLYRGCLSCGACTLKGWLSSKRHSTCSPPVKAACPDLVQWHDRHLDLPSAGSASRGKHSSNISAFWHHA